MSSSTQESAIPEKNIKEFYDKLGKIEKIATTDNNILEYLKTTELRHIHPLLTTHTNDNVNDKDNMWDNYQYRYE
jgi:hypothetical protein